MHEYLDPVVKADQYAQYVDDIGVAANIAADLTRNIRAVFQVYSPGRIEAGQLKYVILESDMLSS